LLVRTSRISAGNSGTAHCSVPLRCLDGGAPRSTGACGPPVRAPDGDGPGALREPQGHWHLFRGHEPPSPGYCEARGIHIVSTPGVLTNATATSPSRSFWPSPGGYAKGRRCSGPGSGKAGPPIFSWDRASRGRPAGSSAPAHRPGLCQASRAIGMKVVSGTVKARRTGGPRGGDGPAPAAR
jgi:hypothetical protein